MTHLNLESAEWLRSTYSGNGGQCVECAPGRAESLGVIPVRDSKTPGSTIAFSTAEWGRFVAAIKGGALPPTAH